MKKKELYSRIFLLISCFIFALIYIASPNWLAMFLSGVSFGGAILK